MRMGAQGGGRAGFKFNDPGATGSLAAGSRTGGVKRLGLALACVFITNL